MITLYHGTSLSNMKNILENGFDKNKIGTGWGTTYGEGIYLSFNPKVANVYSNNSNVVLEVTIKYNPYRLLADYSPTTKKSRKSLDKLKKKIINEGYTCFISPNNEDIILFDVNNIVFICYYYL